MIEIENDEAKDSETIGTEEEGLESIQAGDELEAALREAEEAVDQRAADRAAGPIEAEDGSSADKMTIELLSQELQSLKADYETALAAKVDEDDKLLRLTAEFENFRRRTLKEKQDTFKYGHQNLVKDLLATVDNLERAVVHVEGNKDGDFQSLLQGVELVQRELLGVLTKHGVESIEAEGQLFDPNVHEAMAQIPSPDHPENTVIEVLQAGYMLRDRMLRPARVVFSKAADEGTEQQGSTEVEQGETPGDGES